MRSPLRKNGGGRNELPYWLLYAKARLRSLSSLCNVVAQLPFFFPFLLPSLPSLLSFSFSRFFFFLPNNESYLSLSDRSFHVYTLAFVEIVRVRSPRSIIDRPYNKIFQINYTYSFVYVYIYIFSRTISLLNTRILQLHYLTRVYPLLITKDRRETTLDFILLSNETRPIKMQISSGQTSNLARYPTRSILNRKSREFPLVD